MAETVVRFHAEQDYHLKQRDFVLKLAAFLAQNPHCGAFLALLEAGSALNGATSDLLAAIEDYPPRQYSVLLQDARRLEEVAPYLINLEKPPRGPAALTEFADWLFAQEDFARLGVFFISAAPFLQVKSFWQRFAYTRFANDRQAYFRFYHPRFFDSLLKKLGKKEYQYISSVAEMIFYFDYFNPNIVHVYHFCNEGYHIEQYDLNSQDGAALACSLLAG